MRSKRGTWALRGTIGAAVFVMFAGVAVAWRGRVAAQRWETALLQVSAIQGELDAVRIEREALWGATTDGRAEEFYDAAIDFIDDAEWDRDAFAAAYRAEDDEARAARDRYVAAGEFALANLYRGAHARDATWAVEWERGFGHPIKSLMQTRMLVQLAEMKAATLLSDERELEAVGLMLDAQQLAGDLARSPILIEEMIGLSLLVPGSLADGLVDGGWTSLAPAANERLIDGIAALDRRIGWRTSSLLGELVLSSRGLSTAFDEGGGWQEVLGWEGAFVQLGSIKAYAADHVAVMAEACARIERAADAGPDALSQELARFESRDLDANPLSALIMPKLGSALRSRCYSLGKLRLARLALSGERKPEDPWLDGLLRVESSDDASYLRFDHEIFGDLKLAIARG